MNAGDEVHRYDKYNKAGEAGQYALACADALLFIQLTGPFTLLVHITINILRRKKHTFLIRSPIDN